MQPPAGNPPPQRPSPEFPQAQISFERLKSRQGHQELTGSVTWGGKTHTITWENWVGPGNEYKTEEEARSILQEQLKNLFVINVRYQTDEVKGMTVDLGNQGEIVGVTRNYHKDKSSVPQKTTPLYKQGNEFYTEHDVRKVNATQTLLTEKRDELTALRAQPNYDKNRETNLQREVIRLEQKFNERKDRLDRQKQAQELFFKQYPHVQRPAHMPAPAPPVPARNPAEQARIRAEQERLQQQRQAEEHRQRDLEIARNVLQPMRSPNKPLPVPPARVQRQPPPAQEAEQPPPVPRRPERKRQELDVVVVPQPQAEEPPPTRPPKTRGPPPQPPPRSAKPPAPPPRNVPPQQTQGPPPPPPPRT